MSAHRHRMRLTSRPARAPLSRSNVQIARRGTLVPLSLCGPLKKRAGAADHHHLDRERPSASPPSTSGRAFASRGHGKVGGGGRADLGKPFPMGRPRGGDRFKPRSSRRDQRPLVRSRASGILVRTNGALATSSQLVFASPVTVLTILPLSRGRRRAGPFCLGHKSLTLFS